MQKHIVVIISNIIHFPHHHHQYGLLERLADHTAALQKRKGKKKNTKKTTVLTLLGEGFAQDPGGVKMFPDGFLSLVSRFWIQILG